MNVRELTTFEDISGELDEIGRSDENHEPEAFLGLDCEVLTGFGQAKAGISTNASMVDMMHRCIQFGVAWGKVSPLFFSSFLCS